MTAPQKTIESPDGPAGQSLGAAPCSASAQLEWLWANCKVVYWPKDDRYPIEHNPHAKKYSRDMIEAEMPNAEVSEGGTLDSKATAAQSRPSLH